MKRVYDKEKLKGYIDKYGIHQIFSRDMTEYMELLSFKENDYICKAGEQLDTFFFFVEGKAKVYAAQSNGKSLLLCFYYPFKVLGDLEFQHLEYADCTVQAIEGCYCIGISMDNIRRYLGEDVKFLRYVCGSLGEKLRRLSNYSSINLLYPLENRLSSYILGCRRSDEQNHILFEGNLSEVAELLGTSYRHLLRTLKLLCGQKAIKKNIHNYEVLDIEKLESLAGDLYL
jgi:CRP/FNR family putative post-exponential-phase nitrogen-starvation transcriptional regulator